MEWRKMMRKKSFLILGFVLLLVLVNTDQFKINLVMASTTTLVTQEFFEGFEDGTADWTGINPPIGSVFTRSNTRSKEGTYSGKHSGGSPYRTDQWDHPGTGCEGILTGWVYSGHFNEYSISFIYPVYVDTSNYLALRFYRNYVWLYKCIGGVSDYEETSLSENWNQKWWQFEITVDKSKNGDELDGWVKKAGGSQINLIGQDVSDNDFDTLGKGFVALSSRVGSYGEYWYDALRFISEKPDVYSEGFEEVVSGVFEDWTGINPPSETVFTRDSTRSKEGTYSGYHDGGLGSLYRTDQWDHPGTDSEGVVTGWVYSDHTNYYSRSYIYPVYVDTDNYLALIFYKNYVWLYKCIGGVSDYEQTSLSENWNQKWWQFEITVDKSKNSDELDGWVKKAGGSQINLVGQDVSDNDFDTLGKGFVALSSRVGLYGDYWYDAISITHGCPSAKLEVVSYTVPSSDKGEDVSFSIGIRNTGSIPLTDIKVRIKIKADGDTSYDWSGYICWYIDWDPSVSVGVTEVHSITFDPIFNCPAGWFAWNAGYYKIEKVTATCAEGAYDTRDVEYQFSIGVGTTHTAFVLHLVDQNFRDSQDEDNWFNDLEDMNFLMHSILGYRTDLKTEFQIDLESLVLNWSPGTANLKELAVNKITPDAGDLIGKSDDWTYSEKTHKSNHGFDVLFGHVYLQNTCSEDPYDGGGVARLNRAVLMRYTYIGWPMPQYLGTLHELLHTYDCEDLVAWFFIMNPEEMGWIMHEDTETTLDNTSDFYDGFP